MPRLRRRGYANRQALEYAWFIALCRWRPECVADLLAGGGGGLAVRRWCERWGLPSFCWRWARDFCRQRAKSPWLPAPVAAFLLPTSTTAGWDWLSEEPRHDAVRRLAGEMPRAAARQRVHAAAAELAWSGWRPVSAQAVAWHVRRNVPESVGGEVETLQRLADEFGISESVISDEASRVGVFLSLPSGGRRPGRRPDPRRRSWRAVLARYRPR